MKQTSEALLEFCLTTHYQGACEAITLKHPLLGDLPRRLVRGRTASLLGGSSPLPWTSAVRAFVALALRAALAKEHPTSSLSDPFAHGLSGGRGSHARSLDYAIAKKPAWILDLFGVSADDKPHVGRFFWRNNPEGKRGENVSVALNTKLFPASSIRFVVDNAPVSCPEALQKLLAIIEGSFPTIIHPTFARQAPGQLVASARPEKKHSLHELVVSLAKRELKHTLSATPVFSGTQLREAVSGITSHRLVQSLAGNAHSVLGSVYNWSSPTIRNGLNPSLDLLLKGYSHEKPLTVALSVVTIGSLVLFEYLKRHRNIPLELNYQFSKSIYKKIQVILNIKLPKIVK